MPDNNEARWYIIHTFGGYEKKVKTSIENYAKAQDMENIIQEVYLPTDIVVETKNGKRKEVEKLRFPNYIFLKLVYGNNDKVDKDLWYKIRNTNGVTGFVAPDPNKPTPMTDEDLVKMGLIIPSTVEVDYRIGDLIPVGTRDCVISGKNKLIAAIGLEHIIIVDTDDALLVCDADSAQRIKKVTDILQEQGRGELL